MLGGLELVPTEDLIHELASRYDCTVFAGLRDMNADQAETDCAFSGGAVVARGLTGELLDYLKAHRSAPPEAEGWEGYE